MEPKNILIVDNSVVQCKELARIFTRHGYRTHIATTARDGLDEMFQRHPDLVVLDLILPDMDGLEVCERVRKSKETQNIPVVLFTGRSRIVDILRGFQAGADMYIPKGLSYDKLVNYVKAIFAEIDQNENNVDNDLVMKTCKDLLESLCAAFDGLIRPRLEVSLGTMATASMLRKAAEKLPYGWKVQAMREGTYAILGVRETVVEFSSFVSEVFALIAESTDAIEVGHLKDAFEQQMVFFD